jgi:hypothetical protein
MKKSISRMVSYHLVVHSKWWLDEKRLHLRYAFTIRKWYHFHGSTVVNAAAAAVGGSLLLDFFIDDVDNVDDDAFIAATISLISVM